MIKFSTTLNGTPAVGFGLSEANINKLKEGMPILIAPEDMKALIGVECTVVLMYGKNEEELTKMLEPLITPETKIKT